jgi:hypothetical protein
VCLIQTTELSALEWQMTFDSIAMGGTGVSCYACAQLYGQVAIAAVAGLRHSQQETTIPWLEFCTVLSQSRQAPSLRALALDLRKSHDVAWWAHVLRLLLDNGCTEAFLRATSIPGVRLAMGTYCVMRQHTGRLLRRLAAVLRALARVSSSIRNISAHRLTLAPQRSSRSQPLRAAAKLTACFAHCDLRVRCGPLLGACRQSM